MTATANKRRIYLLWISNMICCGLLFFEYMIKLDYMNYNTNIFGEIEEIELIDSNNDDDDIDIIEDMISWSIEPYSICYIFNKNKDIYDESRICIVTVSDLTRYPHPTSWYPLSRMNRLQYAYNFSYDYCDFPRDWDFTTLRETRWVKFGALYTMLKYYKYVVWIDTDTLFWNKHIPFNRYILSYFHNYTNLSVLFSDHGRHSQLINAGIFIIKNTKFSFHFLEKSYTNYVNNNITKNHADQDVFQLFLNQSNQNNKIMVIKSWHLQSIYVQINPQKFADDYKRLYIKQGITIIFHRIGGGKKKYYQMNDVITDWMDINILNRMKIKCPLCFEDNSTWNEAVKKVDMKQFENQKGNKILRLKDQYKRKKKKKT